MDSVDATTQLAGSEETVNFYEELGLDRDDATAVIHEKLRDMKLGWQGKASRAGSLGDEARHRLATIASAESVFNDDDNRVRYDMGLARKPAPEEPVEVKVDWLTRAWSYYFIHDDGAGLVAARKAREQDPDNAMVYVVSAWLNVRQEELRQAKQDSDEAFVLDELGEDTTDVHHVRGVVFYLSGEHDKAINSFERALAKASDQEKPELYARLSWAYEAKGEFATALDACESGLSVNAEVTHENIERLEETAARMIVRTCDDPSDAALSMGNYAERKSKIEAGAIRAESKARLMEYIDSNIARHEVLQSRRNEIAALQSREKQLAAVPAAQGPKPSFPFGSTATTIVLLLMGGLWSGFIIAALFAGGVATYGFYKLSDWTKIRNGHEAATKELADVRSTLRSKQSEASNLANVIPFGSS